MEKSAVQVVGPAGVPGDDPDGLLSVLPPRKRDAVLEALAQDPRPAYRDDPTERYGFYYAGFDVRFTVSDGTAHVTELVPMEENDG